MSVAIAVPSSHALPSSLPSPSISASTQSIHSVVSVLTPQSSISSLSSQHNNNEQEQAEEETRFQFHDEDNKLTPAALSAIPTPTQHIKRIAHRYPEPVRKVSQNLSTNSTASTQIIATRPISQSVSLDALSSASSKPISNSSPLSLPRSNSATHHSPSLSPSISTPLSDDELLKLASIPAPPLAHSHAGVDSTARYGELYTDSTHFDDLPALLSSLPSPSSSLSSTHIKEIQVWARTFVHGLRTKYEIESSKSYKSPEHRGAIHTAELSMKIHSKLGEYVIGVEGTYREWIESLTIITNKQRYTFGRIARNGKSFRCAIPKGHRVVGFYGSYGVHLHNIGVYHMPITQQDSKRRGACVVEKLKAAFR